MFVDHAIDDLLSRCALLKGRTLNDRSKPPHALRTPSYVCNKCTAQTQSLHQPCGTVERIFLCKRLGVRVCNGPCKLRHAPGAHASRAAGSDERRRPRLRPTALSCEGGWRAQAGYSAVFESLSQVNTPHAACQRRRRRGRRALKRGGVSGRSKLQVAGRTAAGQRALAPVPFHLAALPLA